MHKSLIILIVLLALAPLTMVRASLPFPAPMQPSCIALVTHVPVGGVGLPVKAAPTWFSPDAPVAPLQVGQPVIVFATETTAPHGEVWVQVAGGFAQAYSGPSTNVTQIIFLDSMCGATLP